MIYDPLIHNRRSIRLKGYDYSRPGLYFITICCKDRACLFGDVIDGIMILNNPGHMVNREWLKLPKRFKNIKLHEYIVMPNHFHGILEIVGADLVNAPADENIDKGHPQGDAPTVGDMIGAFQSIVTVKYIRGVKSFGWEPFNGKLWQRNYYEHIIRNRQSYWRISNYIKNNPANWEKDKLQNQ